MGEIDIVFIILHYQSTSDTIECVNSIFKSLDTNDFHIVIVDNASPNKSGVELDQRYKSDHNVHVELCPFNLGFAKGNNVGYSIAKKLNPAFIYQINADTEINQSNLIQKLKESFIKHRFHLLGPDIVSINGEHQNPVQSLIADKGTAIKHLIKNVLLYFLSYFDLDIKYLKGKDKLTMKILDLSKSSPILNPKLHGSAIVFSKRYIDAYEEALDPRTFMYMEEDILYQRQIKNKLIAVFEPDIVISHKEDGSLNAKYKKASRGRRFVYFNSIRSTMVLLKYL